MKEFYQDVKARKAMASGSRHKRNGSKTKFVSLPHDNMTLGAWKKMNGEVVTYDLKSPLTWQQFKELPKDLKIEYINYLQEEFSAAGAHIARCFGIAPGYLYKYLRDNEIHVSFPKGRGAKKDDVRRLNDFFHIAEASESTDTDSETMPDESPEEPTRAAVVLPQAASEVRETSSDRMLMPRFSLHFEGPFEAETILHSLKFMIHSGANCSIDITVTKEV